MWMMSASPCANMLGTSFWNPNNFLYSWQVIALVQIQIIAINYLRSVKLRLYAARLNMRLCVFVLFDCISMLNCKAMIVSFVFCFIRWSRCNRASSNCIVDYCFHVIVMRLNRSTIRWYTWYCNIQNTFGWMQLCWVIATAVAYSRANDTLIVSSRGKYSQ